MATPPTFVTEHETALNNSTSPKTASISAQAGDVLVTLAGTGNNTTTLGTPTGGTGITRTLAQSVVVGSYCATYGWYAIAPTTQSFTESITRSGSSGNNWAFNNLQFRNSDGIGNSAKTNADGPGQATVSITTAADNSAIAVIVMDWNASESTPVTWATVNGVTPSSANGYELTNYADGATYGFHIAYYPDAGAAGAKTVGLASPTDMKWSVVAIEIKGQEEVVIEEAVKTTIKNFTRAAVQRASSW